MAKKRYGVNNEYNRYIEAQKIRERTLISALKWVISVAIGVVISSVVFSFHYFNAIGSDTGSLSVSSVERSCKDNGYNNISSDELFDLLNASGGKGIFDDRSYSILKSKSDIECFCIYNNVDDGKVDMDSIEKVLFWGDKDIGYYANNYVVSFDTNLDAYDYFMTWKNVINDESSYLKDKFSASDNMSSTYTFDSDVGYYVVDLTMNDSHVMIYGWIDGNNVCVMNCVDSSGIKGWQDTEFFCRTLGSKFPSDLLTSVSGNSI